MVANRGGNTIDSLVKGAVEKVEVPQALPVSVAILDPAGMIVGVNDAWRDFGERNGLRIANFGVGESYLHYCEAGRQDFIAVGKRFKGFARRKA